MKSKRIIAVIVLASLSLTLTVNAATPWLHTDANTIKDPQGNVVILRGIDTIDIGEVEFNRGGVMALIDRVTNKSDSQGSSPGWYPRVIRLAVYPAQETDFHSPFTFTPGSDDYYNYLLRPVIDYCKAKDLYAIIDWHFVGDNTYDRINETSAFWSYIAPKFANDSHVLFELFQEPLNTTGANNDAKWLTCRNDMQTWINIIRTTAPNNLILVSGPSWSQTIGPAAAYPLNADNIVMVSHIYPGHFTGLYGDPNNYLTQVNTCLTRYPVFATEWGFRQSSGQANLQGTITNYGQPYSDFREARKISSSAWISDYSWEPQMFNTSWTLLVGEGEMGGFTKDMLYLKRNDNQPTNGDSTPPAAPTGLVATTGNYLITLNWDDNAEGDLYGYDIYRSTTPGSGYTRINVARTKDSNYTDTNVLINTAYYYFVTAIDTSFNVSSGSDEDSAIARDLTPPSVPVAVMATPDYAMVSIDWIDNNDADLAGYNVYRSTTSGSSYIKANSSILSNSNYDDFNAVNNTTYYYVVTAVDACSNESAYSLEVSALPGDNSFMTYNFVGIVPSDINFNAYACDVDVFPFAATAANRNTMVEATDREYFGIAENDNKEWASVNPGSGDQTFLWLEMDINEKPANITRIDFTFNGYTSGTSAVSHRIFVLKAGADWTQNASWVQVGSDQNIMPGVITAMTRSLGSSISTYIDTNGKIVWGVYETTSQQVTHVNYLQMTVVGNGFTNNPPKVFITSPSNNVVLPPNPNINITASAFDGDGVITKVEFYQGNEKLGEDTNSPYSLIWNNVPTGYYKLTARATDDDNAVQFSPDVNITVLGEEGTGAILSEWWTGITGTAVADLTSDVNYPNKPEGREMLARLEGPTNWADNYGTRIRGFLYPPVDGSYTFWICSDANSELWLSSDDNPVNCLKIAYVPFGRYSHDFSSLPQQQSSPVILSAGQKYYIEVLHKAGVGGDNIAVAWQGPAGLNQQVIEGLYLSPCNIALRDLAGFAGNWRRSDCIQANDWCDSYDFKHDGSVLFDDLHAFVTNWLAGAP